MSDTKNNDKQDRNLITGQRIKEMREYNRLSQKQLADLMDYKNNSAIAKIEAGINSVPFGRLRKFADVLNTNVDYLAGVSDNKKRTFLNDVGSSIYDSVHNSIDKMALGDLGPIIDKLYEISESHPKMLETIEVLADYSYNLTDSDLQKIQDFIRLRGDNNRSANDKSDI